MIPSVETLKRIPVGSAGAATALVAKARKAGLKASYHPNGGSTAKQNVPITHSVWVMGTDAELVRKFAKENTPK